MLKPTATITARDLKEALKRVKDTEPNLRKQFVKDIRGIAKEAESPIKQAIRGVTPLSGMRFNYGATGWGVKFAPDATQIRVNAKTGGRSLTTSLVSIKLKSAAASIVDMAGRSDKNIGRAINEIVNALPDNDWICLRDIDTLPMYHEKDRLALFNPFLYHVGISRLVHFAKWLFLST